MTLNDVELMNISGGAVKTIAAIAIVFGSVFAFVTGIIDGYFNPIKCRK